jgi:hypothetical protein
MAGTIEIIINEHLGEALRTKHSQWSNPGTIRVENTGVLTNKALRPDIVVCDDPQFPVAVETEIIPASSVELDAASRLGQTYVDTGGTIYSAIALRLPVAYRTLSGVQIGEALRNEADFEYCILYGESAAHSSRWPSAGYVRGSLDDLAFAIASARASPHVIAQGVDVLEGGAKRAAAILESAAATNKSLGGKIASCLKQESGQQTYRMAATILINALVFQDTIAGGEGALAKVRSVYELGSPSKLELIAEWQRILDINYWPIFGVSKALLSVIPTSIWAPFFQGAFETADKLLSLNLGRNPDLIGTIFQRLISDRRFLATFYTAPQSAALMSRLVIGMKLPDGSPWTNLERVGRLKIADFACGTGSLLASAYAEVRYRLETSGIDSAQWHRRMIENSLIGTDVLPSATHITASQLSSAHPTVQYSRTKILTLPFGPVAGGGVALGAIDLLEKQATMSTIATAATEVGAHADGDVDAWEATGGTAVEDQSFDYIVMNPPFTRLTGGGGKDSEVSRPLFAAFQTSADDQKQMSARATRLTHNTCYHGNAGAGSIFVEIGHRKLVDGGTIGLILPLSAYSGSSWEACRQVWRKHYESIIMLSISAGEAGHTAFSADTGVPEAMIVATRSKTPGKRLISVSLTRRPSSILEGAEIARQIEELEAGGNVRRLEDGPQGGTAILIGEEKVGEALTADVPTSGTWPLFRIRDHAVAQCAYQLDSGRCWLPGMSTTDAFEMPVCPLGKLGAPGPYHLDISGSAMSGGAPRGPFELMRTTAPDSVTYPIIAAHDEARERFLEIPADSEGLARHSGDPATTALLNSRRDNIWGSRTKLHFVTDLRFNANALVAVMTTRASIGGRAWPSFKLDQSEWEAILTLWFNSTLGILTFWWNANKAQDGRGSVTTTRLGTLQSIDPRKIDAAQLTVAIEFFGAFKSKTLRDIHECADDPVRAELDRFVIDTLLTPPDRQLTLDGIAVLRAKLAAEPSISG